MRVNPWTAELHRTVVVTIAFALSMVALSAGPVRGADTPLPARIDFNRDVRPILSDTCFKCHGPDKSTRKSKTLGLDTLAGATVDLGDGLRAIVPGKPEKSEAFRRLMTEDPHELMPPPDSGLTLTQRQKAVLGRWIEQGAEYQRHWALVPPKRPPLPPESDTDWCRNPIDRFVLARLQDEGLRPSPEADRTTLIRRATLDLTGLPPTPAEVEAFVSDKSPQAYVRVIDRLLASPRYGERMAGPWLDAARYADTSGYQIDSERFMWPWRDWVVGAFNTNMPFDQFTVEQIAGDMLPNPTAEQRLATAFNRNHRINDEGGIIPAEFAAEYVIDRVETTAGVFLGLTAGCARCHDHKYDPISQKEFYQLFAFFNNVPEKGKDGRKGYAEPYMRLLSPEVEKQVATLNAQATELETALAVETDETRARQTEWERATLAGIAAPGGRGAHDGIWKTPSVSRAVVVDIDEDETVQLKPLGDGSFLVTGANPKNATYELDLTTDAANVTGIRLEALKHESLPNGSLGRGNGNFVLSEVVVEIKPKGGAATAVKIATAAADYSQAKYGIAGTVDGKPKTGWAVDGHLKAVDRAAVFVFDRPIPGGAGTILTVRLRHQSPINFHTIGRLRLSLTTAARQQAVSSVDPASALRGDVLAALKTLPSARSDAQHARLATYFRDIDPVRAPRREAVAALRRQAQELAESGPPVMVMQEMTTPRDTYRLNRGQYDQPDKSEKLRPALPAALGTLPANAPANRLGLARWLVSAENPLLARVTVNRFWQSYFGTGIVKTSEDFGAQGEWPSHPELLDWLAVEFRESGWDVKRLQRLIVTSATYRQASHISPAILERDPDNRLLARGPRARLDAAAIRDNALAVAGLLSPKMGGPSVKPHQPAGLWEELSFGNKTSIDRYVPSTGEDLYRRGLYTFWKRSVPPPGMSTFDAAGREACALRTGRTNTPLQALTLLNDVTYVEAARALGRRMMTEGGVSDAERITFGWRLATARAPGDEERATLVRSLGFYRTTFAADPAKAKALLGRGDAPVEGNLDLTEHAAFTTVANVILNLDETITKE